MPVLLSLYIEAVLRMQFCASMLQAICKEPFIVCVVALQGLTQAEAKHIPHPLGVCVYALQCKHVCM